MTAKMKNIATKNCIGLCKVVHRELLERIVALAEQPEWTVWYEHNKTEPDKIAISTPSKSGVSHEVSNDALEVMIEIMRQTLREKEVNQESQRMQINSLQQQNLALRSKIAFLENENKRQNKLTALDDNPSFEQTLMILNDLIKPFTGEVTYQKKEQLILYKRPRFLSGRGALKTTQRHQSQNYYFKKAEMQLLQDFVKHDIALCEYAVINTIIPDYCNSKEFRKVIPRT